MVLLYIAVFKKNTEKDFDEKDKDLENILYCNEWYRQQASN